MSRLSLRARMLLLSALATIAALGIAGWAVAGILERFVTQGIDQRLDAQLAVMASAVAPDGTIDRDRLTRRLAVLDAGPEWRWRIAGPRGTIGSADFPELAPGPHPPGPGPDDARRPDVLEGEGRHGRVHGRQAVIATPAGPVTLSAAAPARVIARPIRAALVPLLTGLAMLAGIFAAAALVQLRLALRPVLALRDQVGEIRRGTRTQVDEDQPAELRPLAAELNALADDSAAAVTSARAAAANLAHALKTPVATLALTIGDDPVAGAQLRRIDGVIRHHLARARTAAIGRRATTPLAPVIADVATAMAALHRDVAFDCDVLADLAVAVDTHDLSEIVGNLLDNAGRHARARVTVRAAATGGGVAVTIDDDGPGIPADRREAAMRPGVRLDEGPAGDGFGLSIVRDLLALHHGGLTLDRAPAGGLRVIATLPAAG